MSSFRALVAWCRPRIRRLHRRRRAEFAASWPRSSARRSSSSMRPMCALAPRRRTPHSSRNSPGSAASAKVYYAAKAFLSTEVARWMIEAGLNIDVCSGGELAVALAAGVDPERLGFHGNNKSLAEIDRAVAVGVGVIVLDCCDRDRPRRGGRRAAWAAPEGAAAREQRRARAHARVPGDRARGPEVRHSPGRRPRLRRGHPGRSVARVPRPALATSARRSSAPTGSPPPPPGCSSCTRRCWPAGRCPS